MECAWIYILRQITFWIKLTVFSLGLVGNVIVVTVLKKAFRKRTSNFILKCLILTYTALLVCLVVHDCIEYAELQNDNSYVDQDSFPTKELNNTNIQKVKELMKGGLRIGFFQAIWTAVLILVCQCISVKFPKYVDQVWNLHYICLVLIMLLIISCLAELPLAVHDYKVSYDSNSEKNWRDIYEYIYALGFSSSIPLIILIVSVTILYRDLKTLKKNSVKCKCERVPSIQKMLENTKEITLILFIIVVIFVVSTSFYLIYVIVFDRILRFVTDERIISQCVKPICKDISHLLLGLNAGSSIVIFAWKRQKFRRQLFNFIQRRKFSTISEIGSPNKETKI